MSQTQVKERPILFSGPMIRAILDGPKTQTRRAAKHPLAQAAVRVSSHNGQSEFDCILADESGGMIHCPYGKPGDCLWVRETWRDEVPGCPSGLTYRADHIHPDGDGPTVIKWKPSIFMPRAASRILLELVDVRLERLQDISEEDAIAEGVERDGELWKCYCGKCPEGYPRRTSATASFMSLWDSINRKTYPWNSNPWVWALTFKRLE